MRHLLGITNALQRSHSRSQKYQQTELLQIFTHRGTMITIPIFLQHRGHHLEGVSMDPHPTTIALGENLSVGDLVSIYTGNDEGARLLYPLELRSGLSTRAVYHSLKHARCEESLIAVAFEKHVRSVPEGICLAKLALEVATWLILSRARTDFDIILENVDST